MVNPPATVKAARHPADVDSLGAKLDTLRQRMSLGRHPYLQALRAGKLSRPDLQVLATEHDHVVAAVTVATCRARALDTGPFADGLHKLASAAGDDVDRWRNFALATGWCHSSAWAYAEDPFPGTVACARFLAGSPRSGLGELFARLYTARALQADVALIQVEALTTHYAMDERAVEWFARQGNDDAYLTSLTPAVDRMCDRSARFEILHTARITAEMLRRFYDALEGDRLQRARTPARPPGDDGATR